MTYDPYSYLPRPREFRSRIEQSRLADWEAELLETDYALGDLVEFRKGEEVATGRLVERTLLSTRTFERKPVLGLRDGLTLRAYLDNGYTVSVLARALPTEPGFYVFGSSGLAILGESGLWYDASDRGRAIADPGYFFGKRVPRLLVEAS